MSAAERASAVPRAPRALSRRANLLLLCACALGVAAAWIFARDVLGVIGIVVVMLALIAGTHELAHFVTAKLLGVDIVEFSLGFPPRMVRWRHEGTAYSIGWLPLGGFVRLAGEYDPERPRSFAAASRWTRLVILVSGSVANLLLPLPLLAFTLLLPLDSPTPGRAVITEIAPDSVAAIAGLRPGDVIYEVAGRETEIAWNAAHELRRRSGDAIDLLVRRDQAYVMVDVAANADTRSDGAAAFGVELLPECALDSRVECPPFTPGLAQEDDAQVLGPIGIVQLTNEVAAGGLFSLVILTAVLSVNCGVINLLPLPMLDGGRVLFLGIEALRGGRRFAVRTERLLHFAGLLLVVWVLVLATIGDLQRIF